MGSNQSPISNNSPAGSHDSTDPALNQLVNHLDRRWGLADPRENLEQETKIEVTLELANKIKVIIDELKLNSRNLSHISSHYKRQMAMNREQHEGRQSSSSVNRAATVFDNILETFGRQIKVLQSAISSLEKYSEWYEQSGVKELSLAKLKFDALHEDHNQELRNKVATIEQLTSHARGALELIKILNDAAEAFPGVLKELASFVRSRVKGINKEYLREDSDSENDIMAIFFGIEPKRNNTPLYKNNPILTCFLDETLATIVDYLPIKPQKKKDRNTADKESEAKPKFKATPEFKALSRYIRLHSDGKLITAIKVGKKFSTEVCEAVVGLYNYHLRFKEIYTKSNIEETKARLDSIGNYSFESSIYLARFREEYHGKTKKLADFNPQELFADLTCYSQVRREAVKNNEPQSKDLKEHTELFSEIEKFYTDISNRHLSVSDQELFERLYEFSKRKKDLDNSKQGKLSLDIKESNLSFSAHNEAGGTLRIKPVASPRVEYSELHGKSWQEVKEKLMLLSHYSDLSALYNEMTPRRRTNSNMIVIGPYGCGKNEFARALASDPNIIVVHMSTDRLMTKWFGETESNVRRLFEESEKIRKKYDKPVVISWDEFDALYAEGGDGGCEATLDRVQKALQSLLDGDTYYEGVSLLAMTNVPRRIPVPIYRRFAHVQIIEPFLPEERVSLLKEFIKSLPHSPGLDSQFNWQGFVDKSEYMSGEVAGKIFDNLFRDYLKHIESQFGTEKLKEINNAAAEIVKEKGKISPNGRAAIFREKTEGKILVTEFMLEKAIREILGAEEIKLSMTQQKNFYQKVKNHLASAFQGDL